MFTTNARIGERWHAASSMPSIPPIEVPTQYTTFSPPPSARD